MANNLVTSRVDEDGVTVTVTRVLSDAATVAAITPRETLAGGVWTRITSEPEDNIKVWEITETRAIPGNAIADSKVNESGDIVDVVRTMKSTASITPGESIISSVWTKVYGKSISELVSWEFVEAVALPGVVVPSASVTGEDEVAVKTSQLADSTTITPSATESMGTITTVEKGEISDVVSEKITTATPWLDTASYTISIRNVIPDKFLALLPIEIVSHIIAGTASLPSLGTGEFSRTETQKTKLLFERRVETLVTPSLPVSLIDYETNQYKQLVTVTATLEVSSTPPSTPTALTDVTWINLGNGMALETIKSIPSVFNQGSYSNSIPNLIPEKFRAKVLTYTSSIVSAGTASTNPTLLTGELKRTETQIDLYDVRKDIESFGSISPPITLVDYETNQYKQVVTVTYTLDLDSVPPPTPTALLDVSWDNLGNGYAITTTRAISSVFNRGEYSNSIPNLIPEKFRAFIQTYTSDVTSAGTASTNPTLLTGDLKRTEQQVDEFTKRVSVESLGSISPPISFVDYETNQYKQVVTVTYTLDVVATPPPAPTATTDVTWDNLGNGYAITTVKSVTSVFNQGSYSNSIPNLLPEKFRAFIKTYTSDVVASGTASTNPSLSTGDLKRTESQVTEFTFRTQLENFGSISVPISFADSETNQYKQVVTVTYTLDLSSVPPSTPTALTDVSFDNLGNGYAVTTVKSISAVFNNKSSSISIENLVPREFRGVVPTYETKTKSAGSIVDPPVLGTGDLSKTETQIDEFTKTVELLTFGTLSLPVTLTGGKKIVSKFGIQLVANETITLAVSGTQVIPTGPTVIEAEIKEIGAGMEVLTTLITADPAWPIIVSQSFDEEMQVYSETDEQIVATNYTPLTGTYFTESVKGIDEFHSRRRKQIRQPTAISQATALVQINYSPFQFPGYFDYNLWYTTGFNVGTGYGAGVGYRRTTSQLTKHTIRTWWVSSSTVPVIAVDELFPDTIHLPIFSGVSTIANYVQFAGVLHDDITNAQGVFFPATTPSFTQYALGNPTGSKPVTTGVISNIGTNYRVGDVITVNTPNGSITWKITVVFSGTIVSVSLISVSSGIVGTSSATNVTGGSGTGAQAVVDTKLVTTYSGAWIGTERIISARITPTEIKNLWRIQTSSVIMK